MKNIIILLLVTSCVYSSQNKITEEEVKNKFYEFFDVLSVDNPDKNKLYDIVTDDYFIFETISSDKGFTLEGKNASSSPFKRSYSWSPISGLPSL